MEEVETGTNKRGELSRSKEKSWGCCLPKYKAKRKKFGKVMWKDDQKCDVFKTAKTKVKTNRDISDEHCIRNDDGTLAVSDEDLEIAGKYYNEIFQQSLHETGIVCLRLIQLLL